MFSCLMWYDSPFSTPARASPAPLTRTWEGTDTVLEVCIAESFPVFFLVLKSSFHPLYGCRLGRSGVGRCAPCHLNQTVVWNPPPSWPAEKDLFLKRRMAGVVVAIIHQANSWGQSRVGQQEISLLFLSGSDEVINGKGEELVSSVQIYR